MTKLDDFFRTQTDSLTHPRLRDWKRRIDQGAIATLEVFRPEAILSRSRPEMHLHFTEGGNLLPLESLPWDDDLNAGLIHELLVRAVSPEQEAERFALGLRAAMRRAERECGDGYVNSVLVDLLTDSDLTGDPTIADVLEHVVSTPPDRQGRSYNYCRELIADAIGGRARELTGPLKYPQEEAKRILIAALARYLDDRFSVSARRRLGWL